MDLFTIVDPPVCIGQSESGASLNFENIVSLISASQSAGKVKGSRTEEDRAGIDYTTHTNEGKMSS